MQERTTDREFVEMDLPFNGPAGVLSLGGLGGGGGSGGGAGAAAADGGGDAKRNVLGATIGPGGPSGGLVRHYCIVVL